MFLFINEKHTMRKLTSSSIHRKWIKTIIISSSIFFYGVWITLKQGKNHMVSFSAKFPETFQKFTICTPWGMEVSTCKALWQWRRNLHHSFKECNVYSYACSDLEVECISAVVPHMVPSISPSLFLEKAKWNQIGQSLSGAEHRGIK